MNEEQVKLVMISNVRYRTLAALTERMYSYKEIQMFLNTSAPNVTRVLNALEKGGLIVEILTGSSGHRARHVYGLTEDGYNVYMTIRTQRDSTLKKLWKGYGFNIGQIKDDGHKIK